MATPRRIGRTGVVVQLAILGAVLVLGGCGGDDGDGDGEASTSITTTTTEYQFDPAAWTVPVGTEFTMELTNEGTLQHEWAVLQSGQQIDSEADFGEDMVLFELEAVPAGESASQSFTVDEAGTYQVICAIPGHFDSGMEGSLTVE